MIAEAILTLLGAWGALAAQEPTAVPGARPSIDWQEDLEAALAQARDDHKPLVVCFVASWCSACTEFERGALSSDIVADRAKQFHWVKLDVERNLTRVRTFGIRSTPRVDLLDSEGRAWVRISGAWPAASFRAELDRFLADLAARSGAPSGAPIRILDGSSFTPLTDTPAGYRGLSICYSNVGYGPLRLGSQSPYQSVRYGIDPRTPSTLAQGQWEIHESETWINNFAYSPGNYLLDFEELDTRFAAAYGLSDEVEVELEFEDRSGFGGVMDRFIDAFHRSFGLTDAGRHLVPRNQYQISVTDKNGAEALHLTTGDRGRFAESLFLTVQHNLTCGSDLLPALSYNLTLRSEVWARNRLTGQSPVDPQLTLAASKSVGEVYAYGAVSFAYFGSEHQAGIRFRPAQLSALGALEWRFTPFMSLVLQYLVTQGEVNSLGPFSKNSHEVTLGWKGELVERMVLEIGFIENLINFDNSPDFGVHAGLTVRF